MSLDFLLSAAPIILASDLSRGARLLVPNGLAFGALQVKRRGRFYDWVRRAPDRHHLPGSRHALHLGVDFGFFVRRQEVFALPSGLPVRAPAAGTVAAAFAAGARALEPGGLILLHGPDDGSVQGFTYLGDVEDAKRPGDTVRPGDVVARTLRQRHGKQECVVVHFGTGLSIPGHGLEFLDPCILLRRWQVRHPVFPGSTCTPQRFLRARPGQWRRPGVIDGGTSGGRWLTQWRSRY